MPKACRSRKSELLASACQRCGRDVVGRKERLDRKLFYGDIARRSERCHRAEEGQHTIADPDAQRDEERKLVGIVSVIRMAFVRERQ